MTDQPDRDEMQEGAPDQPVEAAPARPADPVLAIVAEQHPGATFELVAPGHGPEQHVAHVAAEDLLDFMTSVRDAGYDTFIDLCGVDYLRRSPRFEVVINVVDQVRPHRLRVRVGVDGADPVVPSITSVYPGANFYERETYDMFGVEFSGHPDMTRILMPDDWDGYPLRKDFAVGSVPVQFKGSPKAS